MGCGPPLKMPPPASGAAVSQREDAHSTMPTGRDTPRQPPLSARHDAESAPAISNSENPNSQQRSLPMTDASGPVSESLSPAGPVQFAGKTDAIRVLLVEDDETYREPLTDSLSDHEIPAPTF